jgi:hypothetical protein
LSSPAQKPKEISSWEYASWLTASAVIGECRSSREASDGEVEAVAEEMDRTRLAEPAA